jgi:hypothetical protein
MQTPRIVKGKHLTNYTADEVDIEGRTKPNLLRQNGGRPTQDLGSLIFHDFPELTEHLNVSFVGRLVLSDQQI